jgi:PAS domain S-box-containing protein
MKKKSVGKPEVEKSGARKEKNRTSGQTSISHSQNVSRKNLTSDDVNFRAIVENAQDGIALIDQNARFKYVSPAAFRIFGYAESDIPELSSEKLTHPEDLPLVMKTLEELSIDPSRVIKIQYRFRSKDGSWRWIGSIFSNLLSMPGVNSIVINFRDITELIEATQIAEESEFRLRELIDNVDGLVWAVDNDYRLIACNASYQENILKYYGRETSIGENMLALPDISEEIKTEWTGYHKRVMGGEQFTVEMPNGIGKDDRVNETSFRPVRNAMNEVVGMSVVQRDITGRKKNEEVFRQNEEKFRILLDLATDAFFQGNANGDFLLVNNKATELTGYSRKELLRMNIGELFSDNELSSKPLNYRKLNEGQNLSAERVLRRKDNSEVYIEMHSRAMPDGTYQSFFRDITDRKKAEKELQKQKSFFEQMFLQSATSTQILDPEGWCIRINQKLSEIFGVLPENIEGKVYNIFQDEEIRKKGIDKILERVFRKHEIEQWEVFFDIGAAAESQGIEITEKKKLWFANKSYPILDDNGELMNVIVQHEDISERKRAEEALVESELKYRQIIEYSPDGIVIHADNKILFANPSALRMVGADSFDQVRNKPAFDFVHPDFRPKAVERIKSTLETGMPTGFAEEKFLKLNGEVIDVEVISIPIQYLGQSANQIIIRDISERKLALEALKESEDKFRTLAESSPYAIMIYQDDYWIYTNPAGEQLSGYTAEELCKMKFWEIAADEYRDLIKERGKYRQEGVFTTPNYEFKILTKTGIEKWVYLSGSSLVFQGRSAGIISVIDITERKFSEEAIHREQMILRTLIDNLPDSIYFKDKQGRKIVANRADLRLMGISEEVDALGKTDIDMLGEEAGKSGYNDDMNVINLGHPLINSENEITGADGKKHWLLTSKIPLYDENGKVSGLVGIGHDITLRKRAEQIQWVLLQISNAVMIHDDLGELFEKMRVLLGTLVDTSNFYIAYYNEENDMFSIPYLKDEKDITVEWPAGKSATGYIVKNKRSLLIDKDDIETLKQQGVIEIVGEPCLMWLGVPLIVGQMAIGALVIQSYESVNAFSLNDVEMLEFVSRQLSLSIQRKKTEYDLREALTKAEESDRLKTAFLNNMSHEIRTPLNGILGFTSLLDDPETTPEDKKYFYRIINQNGDQLLSIINDIISIATIESGQEKVREAFTNVNEMLNMLYDQFRLQGVGKELMLNYRTFIRDEDSIVKTDETKLRQILTNLIGNALKFTEQGMVEFGCSLEGDMLKFFVTDTGIGIPAEMHQVIFDRFRQANANPRKEYGGNGLGLAISKAYVELLGGSIWLESTSGKGTTFWFTIPYNHLLNPSIKKTYKDMPVSDLSGAGKTLLVAEDVYANYQLLEVILKKMDFTIIHVENGVEAIEACRNHPEINLVLMDVKMPEMDGYEATGLIKKLRPGLPVIAVTAYALSGDKEKALRAGCDDYISKPVKAGVLVEILYRFLTLSGKG